MTLSLRACVLIPVHGQCEFLVEALNSVFFDIPEECKVLVIDDGIDNWAFSRLEELQKKHRNLFRIKNEGTGLVDALNTGVHHSNSEIIFRMDGDDVWLPGRFEKQMSEMLKDNKLVVCGGQVMILDNTYLRDRSRYPLENEEIRISLNSGSAFAHPATALRRDAVLEVGGYRKTFVLGRQSLVEDYDLWIRLAKLSGKKLLNLSDPVIKYRQHDGQISSRFRSDQALATFLTKIVNKNEELIASTLGRIPVELTEASENLGKLISRLESDEKLEYLRIIWGGRSPSNGRLREFRDLVLRSKYDLGLQLKIKFLLRLLGSKLHSNSSDNAFEGS